MRTLTDTLKKAQRAGALSPLYKIVLTKGESSYSYDNTRILPSEHDEEMYSHRAKLVLDNHDHELDDKDLKGYDAVLSYGFGKEYSATSPLSVIDQQFDSDPNKLICTLFIEGMPNLMAEDEASETYMPDEDAPETVKTLVNAIVGATLAPFTHCKAFEVVWDTGYDTLADTYKPKDGFRIYGGSRLASLRRVLDYTGNVPRFEADGKIHIMKPVITGTDFDSEYSLQEGCHTFFSKAYRNSLVFPNKVIVKSRDDDDPKYSGSAQIAGYDSLPDKVKKTKFVRLPLESDDQAEDIAEALIAKAEMGSARGQAEIRINIGSEVFDYVKVTDQRQGDTRTGNLGYIHRRFGGDKWMMTFGFGNWFTAQHYQEILNQLQTYTDAGQYFARLSVGDLYAEHLLAGNMDFVWIDPDNTIDLSKIGDTFDNLPEGEYYYRARKMNLNGETGLTLWEGMKYYIRFSPDSDEAGIRRQDSAPSGVEVGEYWIDTSGAEPIIKRWTGSAWFTIDQDEIDALNKGLLTTHTKLASLSPDGLVLLDEVQIGDDYGLVNKTAISQGKIKLSTQGLDTSLGYGLVNSVDIYNGSIKGTSIVQSSSARLVTDNEKDDWDESYGLALDAYELAIDLEDDMVAGYLTLSAYTNIEGEWYNTGGVKIHASDGIEIRGGKLTLTDSAGGHGHSLDVDTDGYLVVSGFYGAIVQNIRPDVSNSRICGSNDYRWLQINTKEIFVYEDLHVQGAVGFGWADYVDMPRRSAPPTTYSGRSYYPTNTGRWRCWDAVAATWRYL